ncbi:MAG: hypothetical protein Q7R49_00930 [Candidatus Daviesbacteria bacterium]|nr:hypothetical protein [Candidatus Daviesbacteria bacterium]
MTEGTLDIPKQFKADLKNLRQLRPVLFENYPGQVAASHQGLIIVAPTFSRLLSIFDENNLTLESDPWSYLDK